MDSNVGLQGRPLTRAERYIETIEGWSVGTDPVWWEIYEHINPPRSNNSVDNTDLYTIKKDGKEYTAIVWTTTRYAEVFDTLDEAKSWLIAMILTGH